MKQSNPILAQSLLGGGPQQPTYANPSYSGLHKNKFAEGFLGGTGSTSQFQSVNQSLPILPARTNYDLDARISQATGQNASLTPLQPSWRRDYAFAPGLGVDALRSGITWTDANAGISQSTGLAAPQVAPGKDKISEGPLPPAITYQGQGLGTMLAAPYVMSSDCSEVLRKKM